MKNSLSRRSSLLFALLMGGVIAQSSVPLSDPRVRPIGELLKCQCGCPYTVGSCDMKNCHFAEPARAQILAMLNQGKSEQQILDVFAKENGLKILMRPPSEGFFLIGWIGPWAGLAAGLGILWFVVRKLKPKPVVAGAQTPGSPDLGRYQAQIEKETADLE